jgi:hypothetical protein
LAKLYLALLYAEQGAYDRAELLHQRAPAPAPELPPRSEPRSDPTLVTALELAGMDLSGTQLVVLSACDTGRGDVQLGQGGHGLRRSLVVAGLGSDGPLRAIHPRP